MGDQVGTVFIDDVSLLGPGGGGGSPGGGEIAINGDFEAGVGDFTGWTPIDGGGTITVESGTLGGRTGVWGKLVASSDGSAPQDVLLNQANLAIDTVMPGDTIVISFDLYGSLSGVSGVVFVEAISEIAGGSESARSFIGPAPITPTTTWTSYSETITVGSDVSGGLTLQLKAGCGPVPGCGVEAYFDNVSIAIQ